MVAIVIDDLGLSHQRTDRVVALPRPLTLSMLPYGHGLQGLASRARAAGHEVMLHIPMQPTLADADPGPGALLTSLSGAEIDRRLAADLDRFDGYVGVNNHMGSAFTADGPGMEHVMRALHRRGLLFLDSMTTAKSVGMATAQRFGVPAIARDIFIDAEDDPAFIRHQLREVEKLARERGWAVAIGHPHPDTLDALEAWLPGLRGRGIVQVPLSYLVARERPAPAG